MKRKSALKLLCFCLCFVAVFALLQGITSWKEKRVPFPYEKEVLGLPITAETDFLSGKEKRTSESNPGVCFENVLLPYDKSGLCYLSQDFEKEWVGTLSLAEDLRNDYYLCMAEDAYAEDGKKAIRDGHVYTLWMVGENHYYELGLVVSGMPVLSIQEERCEAQEKVPYEIDPDAFVYGVEEMYYGELGLWDPGMNSGQYEILQTNVRYYLKGAVTAGMDKKSYSIKLLDKNEENLKLSLLGMGESSTWKLNSLVTDENKIREITASQIWELFDEANTEVEQPGPKEEYVEVVLNNEYMGLYCVVMPVDEDTLKLDENDVLYKVLNIDVPDEEAIWESIENGWKIQAPIRIRYPKEISDYALAWYPMKDWLNLFYRKQPVVYEEVASKVSLSNLADATMFLMTCSASDNNYKNSYFAARVSDVGKYRMYWHPWDLDFTFGNICKTEETDISVFKDNPYVVYTGREQLELIKAEPQIGQYLLERWQEYRGSFLNTENVQQMLITNRDYLLNTGALEREKNRWPEYGINGDIEYLLKYQEERMAWLDEYFEVLAEE
ncbi:MAG: CotH kinase family protein [Lachnospiraceae bacterium]|nr:CotH kinase family protein [Lachnospiraceae bacterium]